MKKTLLLLLLVIAAVAASAPAHAAGEGVIRAGDVFPAQAGKFEFSADDLAYYGIERGFFSIFKAGFTVTEIPADILVVEFFNVYCTSCQAQAPVLNQVFKAVQKDPDLRAKVRFLGIGAGNSEREVSQFRQRHEVPFPLKPDQRFIMYGAMGEPGGTPFILILKRQADRMVVVGVHSGLIKGSADLMRTLKTAAEKDASDLNQRVIEQDITPSDDPRKLVLNLSPKKRIELVGASMAAACSGGCGLESDIGLIKLPSGQELYAARASADGNKLMLYSKIISQKPLCDVCHGIHYILTFDSKGYIRDFLPIHITKYGNVDWNEYDTENMRRQLLGKRLNREVTFDPTLDAVTSATMSSSLVYRSVNELQAVYKELK